MNTLTATVGSAVIGTCLIHTGSHKAARRVPASFARAALAAGAEIAVETTRGWQPRRIVEAGGRYYTRTVA